jgi:hypothetical protein
MIKLSAVVGYTTHLFASTKWHVDTGYCLEAIDTTRGYVTQRGIIQ